MKATKEEKIQFIAPLFLILGTYFCTQNLPRVFEVRAMSEGLDQQTVSVDGECGPQSGGFVDIVVEGERYQCIVPDKCGSEGTKVAYDGSDPSRCRAANSVGKLGKYELVSALSAVAMLLYGIIGTTVVLVRRRRKTQEMAEIVGDA